MRENENAMKIMRALSDVDGELLERCEGKERKEKERVRSRAGRRAPGTLIWRCAGGFAAVFCLAAVGVVSREGLWLSKNAEEPLTESFSPESVSDAPDMRASNLQADAREKYSDGENTVQDVMRAEQEAGDKDNADRLVSGAIRDCPEADKSMNPENNAGGEEQAEDGTGMTADRIVESVGGRPNQAKQLSESQARAAGLGEFLPDELPEGYGFESAYYYEDSDSLRVCWTRGMDSIMISLKYVDAESVKTVDVSLAESYDERLYGIPHAETVPEKYFESMQNPVFTREDFSLEVVRSRVVAPEGDRGDTGTPRGSFAVLYSDGLLLHFNGRGTPEQVWEMLSDVNGQ